MESPESISQPESPSGVFLDSDLELLSDDDVDPAYEDSSELLHSCSYCPELEVDKTYLEVSESNELHAEFGITQSAMHEAERNSCEFFEQCTQQTRLASGFSLGRDTRQIGKLSNIVKVKNLGITFDLVDRSINKWTGKVHWTKKDGSFASPVGYTPEPSPEIPLYEMKNLSHSFQQARSLLEECWKTHPCKKISYTPMRLIRIHGDRNIVLETMENEEVQYAALSYCWGKVPNRTTTTSSLINMATGIAIKTLPKTIRDSIAVTRSLGIQYLWVDSLCIVQDDPEEKYEQIAQMPSIYKGAYVTLTASCAQKSSDGFLDTVPKTQALYRLPCRFLDQPGTMTLLTDAIENTLSDEPLDRRAWTLQERLLSPRILDFRSSRLQFQCGSHLKNLTPPKLVNSSTKKRAWDIDVTSRLPKNQLKTNHLDNWRSIVESFSKRDLSRPEDKLLAISGIAHEFGINSQRKYMAGLWEISLGSGLLWVCKSPRRRPEQYRAPSWSWASVDGEISYKAAEIKRHYEERQIETWDHQVYPTLSNAKYGSLLSFPLSRLCVSGLVKRAEWVKNRSRLRDPDSGVELDASTYPDADEVDLVGDIVPVHVLNFWQPVDIDRLKNPGSCARTARLSPMGLIIEDINSPKNNSQEIGKDVNTGFEEQYRRVGFYYGKTSNSWFMDAERKAITLY